MPFKKFTKIVKGQKKFCIKKLTDGTVTCYASKKKRDTGIKMKYAFESGWRPKKR